MSEAVERISLSDLQPDDRNANRGSERGTYMLRRSLEKLGAGRSILLDKNGRIIAGNKTAESAADVGLDDVILIRTRGDQLVAVMREDLDLDDPTGQARELAYADNRTGQVSLTWDAEQIGADIAGGVDLGDWFQPFELEGMGLLNVSGTEKGAQPNPRQLPIDVIYTAGTIGKTATQEPSVVLTHCCVACRSGMKYGVQSTGSGGVCAVALYQEAHKVTFIDNDFYDYNHALHLAAVQKWRPKYATVRDVMTEQQCGEAGIAYYPFEQIIEWAEELSQYAENVIVIPKYDCMDRIPARFVLGYSVPTSHGGTPLSVDLFRGRRVHLLGGSWKAQLEYMAALGDDVVSLDNNYINKMSNYGSFVYPDGRTGHVKEDLGLGDAINPMYIAIAVSCGNIGAKVNELYAGSAIAAEGANIE